MLLNALKNGIFLIVWAALVENIRLKRPRNRISGFITTAKYFSAALQAICDTNYTFVYVDIGGYGKQSDGETFAASSSTNSWKICH
jgi:hypothetical protein